MEKIIEPIEKRLLRQELTPERKMCDTNKGGNEVYVIDGRECPNLLREIGRLREMAFRASGGGTGTSIDIDEFDTMENPYKQIIIWDPEEEAIIGGYRFILGPDVKFQEDGQPFLTSSHLYHFSDRFISDYLPYTMELGRSFVAPSYQGTKAGAKGIFTLDNLWDGIAAVMMEHPNILYFFGKMSIYPSFDKSAFKLINHFLSKHFPDPEGLISPKNPIDINADGRILDLLFKDEEFKSDYRNLKNAIRQLGTTIPPLVNTYMNTSPTMKIFGSCINDEFGNLIETGLMVSFNEMYPEKRDRHAEPYLKHFVKKMIERMPSIKDTPELLTKIAMMKAKKRYRTMLRIRQDAQTESPEN